MGCERRGGIMIMMSYRAGGWRGGGGVGWIDGDFLVGGL